MSIMIFHYVNIHTVSEYMAIFLKLMIMILNL